MSEADPIAQQHFDRFVADVGARPLSLGCSTVAHRDLGFCSSCATVAWELDGWRLLAMAERGMVDWTEPGVVQT